MTGPVPPKRDAGPLRHIVERDGRGIVLELVDGKLIVQIEKIARE